MLDFVSPEIDVAERELLHVTTSMSGLALEIKCWLPDQGSAGPSITFLGRELPGEVGTTVVASIRMLCLAPREWLLVADEPSAAGMIERAAADLVAQGAVLIDSTDAVGVLCLRGAMARDVLSKGCGLDLRANAFPIGHCARTCFAQMPVVIDHFDARAGFRLYIARSYLRYLADWVEDAAAEFRNDGTGPTHPKP